GLLASPIVGVVDGGCMAHSLTGFTRSPGHPKPARVAGGCRHPYVGDSADPLRGRARPLRERARIGGSPAARPPRNGSARSFRRICRQRHDHPWRVMTPPDAPAAVPRSGSRVLSSGRVAYEVRTEWAEPRRLAAIHAVTTQQRLSTDIPLLVGKIWPVLREQGARTGHNVVIYRGSPATTPRWPRPTPRWSRGGPATGAARP